MKSQAYCALSLPFVFATVFGSSFAHATPHAAGAPQQVVITAARDSAAPRLDARSVCPGLDAELQDTLARTWYRIQQPSLVRVQIEVEDGRVVGASTLGGVRMYSAPVKRAVQRLSCDGAGAGRHSVAFQVSFADSDERQLR